MKPFALLFLAGLSLKLMAGQIFLAPDASNAEKFVKNELALYYRKVTGKSLYSRDTSLTVYLGKAALDAKWFKPEPLDFEEWRIASSANELVITGDIRGTVWGVYEFIEKYLHVNFFAADTEVVPLDPDWHLPQTDERYRPPFIRREMYESVPYMNTQLFRMRRKESVRTAFPEIRMHHGSPFACHTFAYYVKDWPDDGPFAKGADGKTPCYSSPEARRLFTEKLFAYIKQDREGKPQEHWPLIYDISQNDGYSTCCQCAECKKFPTVADANIDFVNSIAEAVEKDYPEILIQTFAYQQTQTPAIKFKPRSNVIIRSCNSEITAALLPNTPQGKTLEEWSKIAPKIGIWAYWKPYTGEETPYIKPRKVMQRELQFCRDKGVLTYYAENGNPFARSFYALQYYLWSKLTVNPDCNVEKLTNSFLKAYYGSAAPYLKRYLEYLENREKEVPYQIRGNMYHFLDDGFFDTANQWLDQAEKSVAEQPHLLRHVRWERIPVDHALLMRQDQFPLKDDKEKSIARWRANAEMVLNQFVTDHKWLKQQLKQRLLELDNKVKLFEKMPFAVPEQFLGKAILDMHWPDFDPWGVHDRYLIDDPEATSGKAFTLRHDKKIDLAKHKRTKLHELPLELGLYDSTSKQYVAKYLWERPDIPQDEKYHWYKLGETSITKDLRIFMHWSWGLRIFMRKALTGIDRDIPKEIWVSLKITGPTYIENSQKRDGLFVDRVILVEKQNPAESNGKQER